MRAVLLSVMERGFGGRHRKNQPPVTGIHRRKIENVSKKDAVSFRISRINDDMCAIDHDVSFPVNKAGHLGTAHVCSQWKR